MLLATQRPQGAISENIKANTNLRIALRTQDGADSTDILGVGDAAGIPRTTPGRAYVRLGPDEFVKDVFLDSDTGMSLEKLIHYNRRLYKNLEESSFFPGGDFSLEVSSPGLDEPLVTSHYEVNVYRA